MFLFYFFTLLSLFSLLAFSHQLPMIYAFDQQWLQSIYNYSESRWLDYFYIGITHLGSSYVLGSLLLLLVLYLWSRGKKKLLLLCVMNYLGVRLLNFLLKGLFERERPMLQHLVEESSYSFPSGHAMNIIAFFGLSLYLLWNKWRCQRYYLFVIITMLILLVGFSRVYVGVHYPTDILAGYLIGLIWLMMIIFIYRMLVERTERTAPTHKGG